MPPTAVPTHPDARWVEETGAEVLLKKSVASGGNKSPLGPSAPRQVDTPTEKPSREVKPALAAAEVGKAPPPPVAAKSAAPVMQKRAQVKLNWPRLFERRRGPGSHEPRNQVSQAAPAGGRLLALDVEDRFKTGTTSLATLALVTAEDPPDWPKIDKALSYLSRISPWDLRSTYPIGAPDHGLCRNQAGPVPCEDSWRR